MYEHISGPEFNIFTQTAPTNTQKIGDICTIRNGIATLRDKIYIHATKLYDEPCWKPITNASIKQWIIYPYNSDGEILDEEVFKTSNPQTYKYLESNRDELAKRDKGNKQYPKWYSFGRTQSLKIPKARKIAYIPTFVHPSNINIQIDDPILHIGCLSIEASDYRDLPAICEAIKTIRNSLRTIARNAGEDGLIFRVGFLVKYVSQNQRKRTKWCDKPGNMRTHSVFVSNIICMIYIQYI